MPLRRWPGQFALFAIVICFVSRLCADFDASLCLCGLSLILMCHTVARTLGKFSLGSFECPSREVRGQVQAPDGTQNFAR